jgi:serine/threonine protein kinase
VFNGKYKIKSQIGEGKTAMVYLAESIHDPSEKVAIKILKKSLKQNSKKSSLLSCTSTNIGTELMFARKEMEIHSKLDHKTIVKVIECGENGKLQKSKNSTIDGLFFVIMEYVEAGIMYDIIDHFSGVGEIIAKYFMNQMITSLDYLKL